MNHEIAIAVAAGLTSMVGWGTADFFAKKTIDSIGDVTTLFWAQFIGLFPLTIAFILHPNIPQFHTFDPLFILIFGIVSALSYLPLYAGFGKGKVSLLSPIFASYSVVVVILAAIFLHASLSVNQILAIALVFIGILLMSIDPSELRSIIKIKQGRTDGIPQVLSAMLIYSVWLVFFDKFLTDKDWLFPLLAIRYFAVLTLIIYSVRAKTSLRVTDRGLYKYLFGIGLFDVLAFAAVSYGYSHTSYIGIVTVLSATFSLVTIILAFAFLKERMKLLQMLAAALVICGIIIISLG